MKATWIFLATLLFVVPAGAVTVTCVNEGGNVVRVDYNAGDEVVLPVAFALDLTVDGGARITSVYDFKVGDSTAASRGFGIFPASMVVDEKGLLSSWGRPDMTSAQSAGVQPGVGTAGVTLGMASRYSGRENAPLISGTLCRIRVDPRGAAVVNVKVAQNAFGGGVVLENATPARFTGVGCTLGPVSIPQPPASLTYPAASSTGQYTVSWAASTGATSYQLERSANNGSTWAGVYPGAALSYAETVANGAYRYRVRATNSAGSSLWRTGTTNCVVSIVSPPATGYTLVTSAVNGTIVRTPNKTTYTSGETVTLQAVPNAGYTFTGWSGALTGMANPATLVMNANKSVTANFTAGGSSTGIVGTATVLSGITTTPNRRAAPYIAPRTGQLQSMSIYHQGGTGRMILAIYADSAGLPGARLGVTAAIPIDSSPGWQKVSLQSLVSVTAGQKIWLAWVFETSPGIRFAEGTPGRAESAAVWSGGMPATFGAATVANYIYSIYATY